MPVDTARAKSLFLAAADLPGPERSTYLDQQCGSDADLRSRVEALLHANEASPEEIDATKPLPAKLSSVTSGFSGRIIFPGAEIAGRYKLVELIGEGGMGSVWLAEQTEPIRRKVAVKLIKPGLDSLQVLSRFEAERQALALMDHPNIAKVLDGGVYDGCSYFVMELVKGVPITHFCDSRKLTPQQRLELFVPVCQAIQHAHQKGVIHRDIKPANVLVALYDDKPVPKVIDFGVAKATGPTLTHQTLNTAFGGVVGTPQYMSPEQATFNNLDIDTRSDVYSLGVLLYELLTGSPPFNRPELEKRGLLEILRVVREEEPPKPSTKLSAADALPTLSANRGTEPKKLTGLLRNELDWLVMKAIEKERSRRYETANGFAADIQRYLGGAPVHAHPPSMGYRVRKFVLRNRGGVLAMSAVVMAVLIGLITTTYGFYRAQQERNRAEEAELIATVNAKAATDAANQEAEQRRLVEYRAAVAAVEAAIESAKPSTPEGLVRLAGTLKLFPPEAITLRQGVVANLLIWGQEIVPAYTRPGGTIYAISPDGRVGIIALNEPEKGWEARDLVTGHRLSLLGDQRTSKTDPYYEDRGGWTAFSGDGKLLATLHVPQGKGPTVRVWDTSIWRERFNLRPPGESYEVRLNKDGTRLATRSSVSNPNPTNESDKSRSIVKIWNALSGKEVATLDHDGQAVDHIAFSPDGQMLMSASGKVVRLWSALDGKPLSILGPHSNDVTLTAFSPSGRKLAVAAGPWVYWWTTVDGKSAGPPTSLGFAPLPADPDEINRFAFETEEVLIARTWNVHGVTFGSRVGGAVCILGQAKSHTLDAACSDGHFALTDDRHVYSLSPFRRLNTPSGRKFPPEARVAANGRRYIQLGRDLIDLVAEMPIGPNLTMANTDFRKVHASGFGYVVKEMGQYYWNSHQLLIPAPTLLPPDDILDLWARVLACGHIDSPSGLFKLDDEEIWQRNRRELLQRGTLAVDFPFPGKVATDATYWLRQAYNRAKEPAERMALAERLVLVSPTWQNYLVRANTYVSIGRNVEAIREDLRVREMAKGEYKQDPEGRGPDVWHAVRTILAASGRPQEEYELALRWLREVDEDIPTIALALYRLNRPEEAIRELSRLQLPRPTDPLIGLASPWAMVVSQVQAIEGVRYWSVESTLPYVIEAMCHAKLGDFAARERCLMTARKLIRTRHETEDPLIPSNSDWFAPLSIEALRVP
jgi:serine/threonine protein kinase